MLKSKLMLLFVAPALMLSACKAEMPNVNSIPVPVEIANKSVADEKTALTAEATYKLIRIGIDGMLDMKINMEQRAKLYSIHIRAYECIKLARIAYKAGNSADLAMMSVQLFLLKSQFEAVKADLNV
jgi:uncharacterized protein (DUF39 family)